MIWWYTEQMIYDAHPTNGRTAVRELIDSGEVAGTGSFVDHPLTDEKIDRLLLLARNHGPTVVKVHCFLTPYLREVLKQGDAKATFCFRDPRDMILSAMDHRQRAEKTGRTVFEHFTSVADSLDQATYWCRMSCTWVESGLAELFRYVDTVANPIGQIHRLADYFNIELVDEQIHAIMAKENSQKTVGWCEFNKGDLSRYKNEMQPEEIKLCNEHLGDFIRRLGFHLESPESTGATADAA